MIKSVKLLVLSLFALYIGAGWLVKGSTEIALKAKISNLVIGLTIVAFGTSAPELVVSLNASLSGQGDIAVGNIIGSNIFNILFIISAASIINPLTLDMESLIDMIIMFAVTVMVYLFAVTKKKITRVEGGIMTAMYVAYTAYAIIR